MSEQKINWKSQLRNQNVRADMGVDEGSVAMKSRWKRRVFEFLYHPHMEVFVTVLVVVSIVLLIIEVARTGDHPKHTLLGSFVHGDESHKGFLYWLDLAITVVFVAEYVLKFWVAPRKIKFVFSTWIDLLAILPLLRVFRLGRALRMLRLFRLVRALRAGNMVENFAVHHVEADDTAVVAIYLVFSVIFGSIGIMVFEKGNNEAFVSFGDGLWWCLVTLTTVGYGDLYPSTLGGRVVAVMIMFIGLSFYALLTGTISTMLIDRAKKRKNNMIPIETLENHIIVCGWNDNGTQLIENLMEDAESFVLVISESWEPQRNNRRLLSLQLDPSTDAALVKARVEKARVALVLADHQGGDSSFQSIDAKSILTALAISSRNQQIHTIIELLNPDNARHATNAGVNEVIISGAFTGAMMAQTAISPGLTSVFTQLFGDRTVWLATEPLPDKWRGRQFAEVASLATQDGKGALVGVMRAGYSQLDPAADFVLQDGDLLILIRREG